jgi:alginate O-acetyltransferase complex protein AlgJ
MVRYKNLIMASHKNHLLIITVFLASIILPLVFSNKVGGKISMSENRYLATFPTILTSNMKLAPDIKKGLENWINDNAGGRNAALSIVNKVSYKIFHLFPEDNVVEGIDDWLYVIHNYELSNFVNTNIPTQKHFQWLKDNFSRITGDLRKKGIEYTVIIWPYKFNIYPEYFPDTLIKVNNLSEIEVLDRNLSNSTKFDFKTAYDVLNAAKEKQLVYYKAYDLGHWNNYGALLGYTELMRQAQQHIPGLKILTEKDFTIKPVILDTNLPWGFHTQEQDLQYTLKNGNHARSDITFFNTFNFVSKDPWKSYNYYENTDSSLPKAVIVGDSFVWMFMLPDLAESFSQLVFIHFLDLDNLNSIINIVKPDIVIMAGLGPAAADLFASYHCGSTLKLDARIVSTNTPSVIIPGTFYDLDITVKNVGTETWNENKSIRLAIFHDGIDYYRAKLPDGVNVKPGEVYTFKFEDYQAPPGKSTVLQYQMVEETVEYFGEKKPVEIAIK